MIWAPFPLFLMARNLQDRDYLLLKVRFPIKLSKCGITILIFFIAIELYFLAQSYANFAEICPFFLGFQKSYTWNYMCTIYILNFCVVQFSFQIFFHYVFFFPPLVQTCQRFAYITDFLQRKIFAFSGFCCISILCSALYYFLPWVYLAAFLLILSSFVSVFLCSPISIFKAVSFSQYHLTVKC